MLIIYFIYSGSSRTDNSGILLEDVRFEFRIKNYKSNYRLSAKVSPQIYNDDKTHLFVHCESNYTRGCTNLQCQGFVQTDKYVILDQPFNQTSTIDGLVVELPPSYFTGFKTKSWYIYIDNKEIGYYPASLFNNMTSANQVMWIGETINSTQIPSPQWVLEYNLMVFWVMHVILRILHLLMILERIKHLKKIWDKYKVQIQSTMVLHTMM
ncbi:hypothetical protein P8452_43834 [Trifolium repens]|nr:hypothetical protein P8452_43834 [Trifolium repens]